MSRVMRLTSFGVRVGMCFIGMTVEDGRGGCRTVTEMFRMYDVTYR